MMENKQALHENKTENDKRSHKKKQQNNGWLIELLLKSIPRNKRYEKFSMSSGTPPMHSGVNP
jgi:hypothetical protein